MLYAEYCCLVLIVLLTARKKLFLFQVTSSSFFCLGDSLFNYDLKHIVNHTVHFTSFPDVLSNSQH